jgi:hypothetical protein
VIRRPKERWRGYSSCLSRLDRAFAAALLLQLGVHEHTGRLNLRGSRSNADDQAGLSGPAGLAETTGAVVGFPEAIVPIDSRYGWDLEGDLEFLTALVAELVERYHPPDPKGGRRGACPAEG